MSRLDETVKRIHDGNDPYHKIGELNKNDIASIENVHDETMSVAYIVDTKQPVKISSMGKHVAYIEREHELTADEAIAIRAIKRLAERHGPGKEGRLLKSALSHLVKLLEQGHVNLQ